MIDHFGINVRDIKVSKAFYMKTLEPLGYKLAADFEWGCSFTQESEGNPAGDFWLLENDKVTPLHFAFRADNSMVVDQFYQAGLEAGGKDNGQPGIREKYHPNYYGAFLYDPDEYNIEAVCHGGEENLF